MKKKMLATAAIAVMGIAGCSGSDSPKTMRHDPHQPTVDCLEDQPCWDCGSMGNMVCGTFEDAQASADRCRGHVYFHAEGIFTTVCPT